MTKIVYRQMPAPSESYPNPRAKDRMQKPQGGGKSLVQIPWGARGMVMNEIDTCINVLRILNKINNLDRPFSHLTPLVRHDFCDNYDLES